MTTRLWFWLVCAVRVLFDTAFAARVYRVRDGEPRAVPEIAAPPRPSDDDERDAEEGDAEEQAPTSVPVEAAASNATSALMLLALLQREGRLVDFLEQDIADFDDAAIGAAARVVHDGCRKALRGHAHVAPVRDEDEEARVEVSDGIESGAVKLTGNVGGKPPYRGVLRHRGWRVSGLSLPTPTPGHDPQWVAPAEVEL
jgi:hypothetical protein